MDKLLISQDGSHTIESFHFGVTYHSKYGAIQESQTVFLDAGLQYILDKGLKDITIFEMGFGTGLNVLMTLNQAPLHVAIDFHTVEAFPISYENAEKLNYPTLLDLTHQETDAFRKMHSSKSGEMLALNDHFSFTKYISKIEDLTLGRSFDIIFYDAFAPSSQEELWTPEMMSKLYGMTAPGGVLVSYCAKGSFKRALKSAGYIVEGLPGPIGKREMTRAIRPT